MTADATADPAQTREKYRARLAELRFDGPHGLGGGLFSREGAVCLTCGSLVMLGDPEGDPPIERGIRLHVDYHERRGDVPVIVNTPEPRP